MASTGIAYELPKDTSNMNELKKNIRNRSAPREKSDLIVDFSQSSEHEAEANTDILFVLLASDDNLDLDSLLRRRIAGSTGEVNHHSRLKQPGSNTGRRNSRTPGQTVRHSWL